MRKNFTCKFNGYVTPDNREGIVRSIISQLQSYDCDPEATLTDDGIIVSVTLNGDLTPSLIRDKLVFNYFITSVSTGDTIRKIKKMVLPKATRQFKNVSPFVDPMTLDEHVTSTLDPVSGGPQRSFTIGDDQYMLSFRRVESHFSGVGHPVPGTIPELLRHLQDHHPEIWEDLNSRTDDMADAIKRYGWDEVLAHDNGANFKSLSEFHLELVHDQGGTGGIAGDHPHHHREEQDTSHFDDIDTDVNLMKILQQPKTTIVSSWVKQADPTGDMLPGILTGDGPKDEFISDDATEITKRDLQQDIEADASGERKIVKLVGGSKTGASVGDANGPSMGLYSPPEEIVDVRDSQSAAPEGTGLPRFDSMISNVGPVIPNTSLVSDSKSTPSLIKTKNNYNSLGIPNGATPSLGLAAFKKISVEEPERTTQINMADGGAKPALGLGEDIEPWFSVASKDNIYLGLADEHPYDEESTEDEF